MANHASALKRIRQTRTRTARNMERISRTRTYVRRVEEALMAGDGEAAKKAMAEAMPILQRSAQAGSMKKKTASRKISRLTRRVKALNNELVA